MFTCNKACPEKIVWSPKQVSGLLCPRGNFRNVLEQFLLSPAKSTLYEILSKFHCELLQNLGCVLPTH